MENWEEKLSTAKFINPGNLFNLYTATAISLSIVLKLKD